MNETIPSPLDERRCPRCRTLFHSGTRHCIECGFTPTMPIEDRIRLGLVKPHKKLEPEDGQSVLEVMKAFNLTLPSNAIQWRVARRSDGNGGSIPFIPGTHPLYEGRVTALLTDGIVAFFAIGERLDSESPIFFGHLANLTPDEPEKSERDGSPKKPREETKRQLKLKAGYLED
jgi:hypothetical protein